MTVSPLSESIVAAVQMVSGIDLQQNLQHATRLLAAAAAQGAKFVVLPENFAVFGGGEYHIHGRDEVNQDGPIRSFLSQQARHLGIWIVGGTLPTVAVDKSGNAPALGKVYTSVYVINAEGIEVGRYDKIHLFDVDVADAQGQYRESDYFSPGHTPLLVDTPWGKLGVGVCYDLRFPEYFRLLRDGGADIIAIPAAFTYRTGQAHWEVLLRARAIENQCYVIGAGQGGWHSEARRTWGDSCIISPWGEKLVGLAEGEGVVCAPIDRQLQQHIRRDMPVQKHRKFK